MISADVEGRYVGDAKRLDFSFDGRQLRIVLFWKLTLRARQHVHSAFLSCQHRSANHQYPTVMCGGTITTILCLFTRDLRIVNFRSNRISNRIGGYDSNSKRIRDVQIRLIPQTILHDRSNGARMCVCAVATTAQLHVKWSCTRASEAGVCRGSDTPTIYVGDIDMYVPLEKPNI